MRPRVVVAGASGFVGRVLVSRLAERFDVVALSRSPRQSTDGVRWVKADLFSLLDCERAMEGADRVVYLVHSMQPSARLSQGRFADMDLILADNVARAAKGTKQILYLGGLIPEGEQLSEHLRSRLEVERALAAHGTPVTTLRAGLVIGPGGSSFRILRNLVERLPVMICPEWTESFTQPIDLDTLLDVLIASLSDPKGEGQTYDVGGPERCSYRSLISRTATVLGRKRLLIPVPVLAPPLSAWWVTLVTGSSRALVTPLVESLRHTMVVGDRRLQERLALPGQPIDAALSQAVSEPPCAAPPRLAAPFVGNTVRSVQRLTLPAGWDATRVTREYMEWLPRGLWPLITVSVEGERCTFCLRGLRAPLLVLRYAPERSTPDRTVLYIQGGLLAQNDPGRARLEFRVVLGGDAILAAIHDFVPQLPWFIYNLTQAPAHLWVMFAFGRHLKRLRRTKALPSSS